MDTVKFDETWYLCNEIWTIGYRFARTRGRSRHRSLDAGLRPTFGACAFAYATSAEWNSLSKDILCCSETCFLRKCSRRTLNTALAAVSIITFISPRVIYPHSHRNAPGLLVMGTLQILQSIYKSSYLVRLTGTRDWSKPPSVNWQRHIRGRQLNDDVGLFTVYSLLD